MNAHEKFRLRFIKPLLDLRPHNIDEVDYLTQLLHLNSRPISGYRAKAGFTIDGQLLENDTPGHVDLDPKNKYLFEVAKGDYFMVRTDDSFPGTVDIEHKGRWFVVSRIFWDKLVNRNLCKKVNTKDEEI